MRKIFLVDDNSAYTWCLQKYLQNRGYRGKTANTLEEARIAIKEEILLLICCDLDLPDGSGLELLDMVRAAYGTLPFILASCHEKKTTKKKPCTGGNIMCG
ncbi:Regulator of RpoS [Eubacterium plexicaudatum ASF492]|nr:Regulator of RpoS [Eubacterium plexicaudatum ASF492]